MDSLYSDCHKQVNTLGTGAKFALTEFLTLFAWVTSATCLGSFRAVILAIWTVHVIQYGHSVQRLVSSLESIIVLKFLKKKKCCMCLLLATWISQGALPCSNQAWTEQAAAYPLKCLLPLRLKVFGSPILTCMLTSVDNTLCVDQYRFNHDKWFIKHKRKQKKHIEKVPAFSRTPLLVVTLWNHYNNDLQPTLQKKQMTSASACDTVIICFYSDATQSTDTASLISSLITGHTFS